jgi:anti-sigma factor ChrR (cupin superfamily)
MESSAALLSPLILANLFLPHHLHDIAWQPFHPGIEIFRLTSAAGGSSSALLRYAAGARLSRHVHHGYEHILILTGSQIDDAGEHHAGTLLVHPPQSSHAISSPNGCVVLAIWEKPVRFLDGH